ncbi:hypothetical protein PHLCEN_2v7056 [Hermanssonia centrifuga]|uniref:Uncharacterized protein n=1 Tax=Hermanssonia centrifuga TaxID=98765 RepID=A0A2R6NXN0_9APHY|nr:hypothetical protein PHLCEN_2v7056 [Hermanssonia centrifuga]
MDLRVDTLLLREVNDLSGQGIRNCDVLPKDLRYPTRALANNIPNSCAARYHE